MNLISTKEECILNSGNKQRIIFELGKSLNDKGVTVIQKSDADLKIISTIQECAVTTTNTIFIGEYTDLLILLCN
jgi:hypothetical protein